MGGASQSGNPGIEGTPPALAGGVEPVGQYQGSGLVEAVYLLRHGGRTLAVSPMLYSVVSAMDGRATLDDIAARVSAQTGREVHADDVAFLIEHKLVPLGVASDGEGAVGMTGGRHAGRNVTARRAIIPERLVWRASRFFAPLFRPAAAMALLVGFTASEVWLWSQGRVTIDLADLGRDPAAIALILALTVAAGCVHELGHAAAAAYSGARPGAIGVGIYLLWPVFFSDMTDSYRLTRRGRLRVDLGGVYFNLLFMIGLVGLYGATGASALLVAVGLQHVMVLQQFLPFVRLDGYYILTDLAGVPDLFGRMRPTLRRLLRRSSTATPADDLRPGARVVVAAWAVATVLLLGGVVGWVALRLPDLLRAAIPFINEQALLVAALMRSGDPAGLLGALRLALLAVPTVGLGLPLLRGARRVCARRPSAAFVRSPDAGAPSWAPEGPFASLRWPSAP
jgi:putative peptide zinc metalloprotease protein